MMMTVGDGGWLATMIEGSQKHDDNDSDDNDDEGGKNDQ